MISDAPIAERSLRAGLQEPDPLSAENSRPKFVNSAHRAGFPVAWVNFLKCFPFAIPRNLWH
jgi:hypothetical protein